MDALGSLECLDLLIAAGADVDPASLYVAKALEIARTIAEASPSLAPGRRSARCIERIEAAAERQQQAQQQAHAEPAHGGAILQPPKQPATRRRVQWAADVASPGPESTREALHRLARTMDLPIPWRDPVRFVRLKREGETTHVRELDWDAIYEEGMQVERDERSVMGRGRRR